jgi:hypothetical protein
VLVEAVFEDLKLKQEMLRTFETLNPQGIFATNTSSIPIGEIAAASAHPETVLGMHYFSPVNKMPLLEVIVTPRTADEATATAVALGKKQGKTVIVVGDGPGFFTSRVLAPYMNEAVMLLLEGASVEDIDGALTGFGFPVGPMTLLDEVGIDVGAKVAKVLHGAFGERMSVPEAMGKVLEASTPTATRGRRRPWTRPSTTSSRAAGSARRSIARRSPNAACCRWPTSLFSRWVKGSCAARATATSGPSSAWASPPSAVARSDGSTRRGARAFSSACAGSRGGSDPGSGRLRCWSNTPRPGSACTAE